MKMKAFLLRTGSAPIPYYPSFVPGSTRISLSAPDSVSGLFSGNKNGSASIPRISLHCEASRHTDSTPARSMRKVSSETDTILSETAGSGGNADRSEVGAYYKEMLKSDPSSSLVLANYGRFLHQVEGDMVKAEEYYGRALLESPEDGEVLSLYGTLIWETQRDQYRANSYFDQALHASPHDCTVLGSYAHFMWEAEEEDGGDSKIEREN